MRINLKVVVCIVYASAMFMAAMDATVVNVALKTISSEFQVAPSTVGLITVGYLVSLAVLLPVAGWLGDRWGTKRIFLIALAIFTIASVMCGLAESLGALTVFRIIQGAGGGLLTPVGMAMLFRTFTPQERPSISRILILPIAVAPAVGPTIGGFFVDQLSWRWVFYINLPIGIISFLVGLLYLREHKEPTAGKLDLPGFLLSAIGFPLLMYASIQGPVLGWNSPVILFAGIGGLTLIISLIITELRVSKPMLELRLLSERLFRTLSLVSFFSAAGLLGMLYVFPLMYQNVMKASALDTGLTIFPEALGLMLASQLVPRNYRWLGPKRLIAIVLLLAAATFVLMSLAGQETNPWLLRILLFCAGFFLGHAVGSVQIASFANIPPASMGRATTLFIVQNRLGSAIGLALLASLLAGMGAGNTVISGEVDPTAYRAALLGAAVFLLAALGCVLSMEKADTAAAVLRQPKAPIKAEAISAASD